MALIIKVDLACFFARGQSFDQKNARFAHNLQLDPDTPPANNALLTVNANQHFYSFLAVLQLDLEPLTRDSWLQIVEEISAMLQSAMLHFARSLSS